MARLDFCSDICSTDVTSNERAIRKMNMCSDSSIVDKHTEQSGCLKTSFDEQVKCFYTIIYLFYDYYSKYFV